VRVEILIALVCCAVTTLGVVYLGAQLFNGPPPPSQPQARGIVWGGRTFVDLAEFGRWLRSRGVAYEIWALRHPTRAGIARLQPPAVPRAQRGQPSGADDRSTWTTTAGVAVVLAALFLLLGIRRRKWLSRMRRVQTREQLDVAAQGISVGGRAVRRQTIAGLRASSMPATSAALVLVAAARAAAPAIAAAPRLMLRLATLAARASSTLARAGGRAAWRQRQTVAWSAAVVLLATISALAVTVWA
jgi:LPXTG-motif cell wall-anchored protein